jgi:hypothetical protein
VPGITAEIVVGYGCDVGLVQQVLCAAVAKPAPVASLVIFPPFRGFAESRSAIAILNALHAASFAIPFPPGMVEFEASRLMLFTARPHDRKPARQLPVTGPGRADL